MSFEPIALLRLYLGDPDLGNGVGDAFTDAQLQDLLSLHDDEVVASAADGWRMKAATVSTWYQATTDGSSLSRHQVFEHCMAMAEVYDARSENQVVSVQLVVEDSTIDEETGELA